MGNSHLRGYSSVSPPSDPRVMSDKPAELIGPSVCLYSGIIGRRDRGGDGRLPDGSRQDQVASAAPFAGRPGGYTQIPVCNTPSQNFIVDRSRTGLTGMMDKIADILVQIEMLRIALIRSSRKKVSELSIEVSP